MAVLMYKNVWYSNRNNSGIVARIRVEPLKFRMLRLAVVVVYKNVWWSNTESSLSAKEREMFAFLLTNQTYDENWMNN
jgi:hypothetical protein